MELQSSQGQTRVTILQKGRDGQTRSVPPSQHMTRPVTDTVQTDRGGGGTYQEAQNPPPVARNDANSSSDNAPTPSHYRTLPVVPQRKVSNLNINNVDHMNQIQGRFMYISKRTRQTKDEKNIMIDNLNYGIEAYERMSAAKKHASEAGGDASVHSLSNKE